MSTRLTERANYLTAIMPHIGKSIRDRLSRMKKPMDHQMTQGQMQVLHYLKDEPPITMQELARRDHVAMSTMTETIKRMVRQGWVERLPDEADRRRVRIRITAQGSKKLQKKYQCALESFQELLNTLDEADQVKLVKAFQTIERILKGKA